MSVYKRDNIYWIRFQFQGREIRKSAHTTDKRRAETFERRERQRLVDEYHGGRPKVSFSEAFERYCREGLPQLKIKTAERYLHSFGKMAAMLEPLFVADITKRKIEEIKDYRRRDGVSPSTINRDMTALSAMLTYCVDWDYIEINPFRTMAKAKLKEPPARREYLTHEDEAALLDECAPHIHSMVVFAIETGLRLMEQMTLEWRDVNVKRKEIYIRETKTDVPRTVPLTDRALAQLSAHPQRLRCPLVFPNPEGMPYRQAPEGFRLAKIRAGLQRYRWHDLRKTCGTRLLQECGFTMDKVKEWLGHKSIVTTERAYAFLESDDLHAALGRTKSGTGSLVIKKEG